MMTRSQSYAADRSKTRSQPIVLFDEAEVALFMEDMTLFPVVPGPILKGWEMVRSIVFTIFNLDAVEREVLSLVTNPEANYGFALTMNLRGQVTLGVFEKVRPSN